jgi:hypothetical protein
MGERDRRISQTGLIMAPPPNQSPEPTAVGACRSAVAVYVANTARLSFFR